MQRVRRPAPGPVRRMARTRVATSQQEELPLEDEESEASQEAASHGVDMDDDVSDWIDPRDSPDNRAEDETEQEAGNRIEAKYKARAKSPLKAIRAFCVICVGCYPREVAKCTATDCVLHPFRFGTNPYQKRTPK